MRASQRLSIISNHLLNERETTARSDCCGIVAVVSQPASGSTVAPFLIEGLKILEARGYDSVGMTTIDKNNLVTSKFASSGATSNAINKLEKTVSIHEPSHIGIAHTRWATHGGATDLNAHPHHDSEDRIAVAHNGVIENFAELRKFLQTEHNIEFKSETDTEVISQLIGIHVKQGNDLLTSVKLTLDKLKGTWGLVILDKQNPDKIIAAKNGSPILIGIGQDRNFVASEPAAFSKYTKEFISLEDNEVAVLTATETSLDRSRIEIAAKELIQATPDPYPHWTIKEIMEQPEALARALNYGGRIIGDDDAKLGGLDRNSNRLKGVKHLVIAACGTSYYAGLLGAQLMRYVDAFETIQVIDAAELEVSSLPPKSSALLVISQSGETKDVHRALSVALNLGIPSFSVVNAVGSLIARSTECGVYLNAGRENAVASTKAFSCTAAVLALISVWFSKQTNGENEASKRKIIVDALHRLPTNVGMVLRGNMQFQCRQIAKRILERKSQHMFVLGKGFGLPIALEGALKIKEISYIHAEGYPGGALKHGPFALITEGTPIIFIILDDPHAPLMKVAVEETRARGADTITITNIRNVYKDTTKDMGPVITVPNNGALSSLLCVLPLQLLAYELSVLQDINPDRPRHLAKTVTVG